MQDLIAIGVTWFEQQRKAHMAVNVEYRALGSQSMTVVPAMKRTRLRSVKNTPPLAFATATYSCPPFTWHSMGAAAPGQPAGMTASQSAQLAGV